MSENDQAQNRMAAAGPAADPLGAGLARHSEYRIVLPFGILAIVASAASLATCYVSILSKFVFGIGDGTAGAYLNPHVQAVIMWMFAMIAVWALWRDRALHTSPVPVILGGLATAILVATLYISYDNRIELLAYILLVAAALLNQNAFLGRLYDKVVHQAGEIDALNRSLRTQVDAQEAEIDRLGQLKQFLAPQVADLIVSEGRDELLDSHRRYIACLFCDLRGFTALSEAIEPEEVMAILQAFHDRSGELVSKHGGTIGFRAGDGMMAFFNDPIPCDNPTLEAVNLAFAIREAFEEIRTPWAKLGYAFGLGTGIASGFATMGLVGVRSRADYTAIGGVVNIASRICDRAEDGQILINHRAFTDIEGQAEAERIGAFELKGVGSPVDVYAIGGP